MVDDCDFAGKAVDSQALGLGEAQQCPVLGRGLGVAAAEADADGLLRRECDRLALEAILRIQHQKRTVVLLKPPGQQILLESMERHLAGGLVKVYDPWVKRDLVPNQYHDFDAFLKDVDMVVILVGHSQLLDNMDRLQDKVVLDTRHVCQLPGVHRL